MVKNRAPIACVDLKYYRYVKNPNLEKPFGFSLIGATSEFPDFHFSASDRASENLWESYLSVRAMAPVDTFGKSFRFLDLISAPLALPASNSQPKEDESDEGSKKESDKNGEGPSVPISVPSTKPIENGTSDFSLNTPMDTYTPSATPLVLFW